MYKKSISIILAMVAVVLLSGCSKQSEKETSNTAAPAIEDTLQQTETLHDTLNGKFIHIVEDLDDTGTIYYFKDNEIVLLYGYHGDIYKIEDKKLNDNLIYNLSSQEFGEPDNIINSSLNLSQNDDGTINMKWEFENGDSFEENNLKLMTAKECVQSIVSSYPSYEHDRDWDDFGLTSELFQQVYNEMYEKQLSNKITEEKALELCKEKVENVWDVDSLILGDDMGGMDKIVDINNNKYYGIYYINDDMAGDFRFCVNISTGEVFYQTSADLQSLTPIDKYLQEFN